MQMLHYYSIVSPLPLVSTQRVYLNCLWSIRSISEICTVMVKNFRGFLLQTERLRCHSADWQSTATEKYDLPAVTVGLGLCSLMLILLRSKMSVWCLLLQFCDICSRSCYVNRHCLLTRNDWDSSDFSGAAMWHCWTGWLAHPLGEVCESNRTFSVTN